MLFPFRRWRPALLAMAAVLLAPVGVACTTAQQGSATPAVSMSPAATSAATPSIRAAPTTGSVADSTTDIVSEVWTFAHVQFGTEGIPSPTGDLTAQPAGNRICFRPGSSCAELADQDRPEFAVYSPDGAHLLTVAGPDGSPERSIYVLDTDDAAVRVIGPDGVAAVPSGGPPRWNLSSVAWSADGSAVVIVPHTEGDTGQLLSVDLAGGSITEMAGLTADVANGRPSIWPTDNGTALVLNEGADRQALWWQYPGAAAATTIAEFQQDGGSLQLSAADPLGRVVLACPRSADGRLGATVFVGVDSRKSGRLLNDSPSCAGAVFSPDSRYVALTAELAGSYSLVVTEVMTNRRVLTVPLPVSTPSQPPYLTWLGDVVVAADVSGEWSAPSLVMRLGP